MKEIVLGATLIAKIIATAYQSVPSQTDSSPFYTATNEHVRPGGVAISRDLLCGACRKLHRRCDHPEYPNKVHYGDWLFVDGIGFLQANDAMGKREHYTLRTNKGRKKVFKTIRNHIDVWVASRAEEHAFYKKWDGKTVELWKIEVIKK